MIIRDTDNPQVLKVALHTVAMQYNQLASNFEMFYDNYLTLHGNNATMALEIQEQKNKNQVLEQEIMRLLRENYSRTSENEKMYFESLEKDINTIEQEKETDSRQLTLFDMSQFDKNNSVLVQLNSVNLSF